MYVCGAYSICRTSRLVYLEESVHRRTSIVMRLQTQAKTSCTFGAQRRSHHQRTPIQAHCDLCRSFNSMSVFDCPLSSFSFDEGRLLIDLALLEDLNRPAKFPRLDPPLLCPFNEPLGFCLVSLRERSGGGESLKAFLFAGTG